MNILSNLVAGKRYIFTKQNNKHFNATFVDITDTTLRVTLYQDKIYKRELNRNSIWTMPIEWIIAVKPYPLLKQFTSFIKHCLSKRKREAKQERLKENVDEAQRIEVFRLNSVDGSRRSLFARSASNNRPVYIQPNVIDTAYLRDKINKM